jgi:hypothetical protein
MGRRRRTARAAERRRGRTARAAGALRLRALLIAHPSAVCLRASVLRCLRDDGEEGGPAAGRLEDRSKNLLLKLGSNWDPGNLNVAPKFSPLLPLSRTPLSTYLGHFTRRRLPTFAREPKSSLHRGISCILGNLLWKLSASTLSFLLPTHFWRALVFHSCIFAATSSNFLNTCNCAICVQHVSSLIQGTFILHTRQKCLSPTIKFCVPERV